MRYDNFINATEKSACACGKMNFDKKTATTKMNWLKKKGNEKFLRIYQCPQSDYWHLTSTKNH